MHMGAQISPQGPTLYLHITFKKLLTIDHDCPVPVDKHGSVIFYPTPLTPPTVRYLNFAIIKAVVNIFAEILHAGREAKDMKYII